MHDIDLFAPRAIQVLIVLMVLGGIAWIMPKERWDHVKRWLRWRLDRPRFSHYGGDTTRFKRHYERWLLRKPIR